MFKQLKTDLAYEIQQSHMLFCFQKGVPDGQKGIHSHVTWSCDCMLCLCIPYNAV